MGKSAWQSIETAPKDRSVIAWEDGVMGEAYYYEDASSWWWANTAPGDFDPSDAIYPTLWHPMPDPPVTSQIRQGEPR